MDTNGDEQGRGSWEPPASGDGTDRTVPGQGPTAPVKASRLSPVVLIGASVVLLGLLGGIVAGLLIGRSSSPAGSESPSATSSTVAPDRLQENTTSTTTEPPATEPATTHAPPPTAPPTTAPPLPSIRTIDFENWDYEIDCDGSGIRTIPVRDGSWVSPEGPTYGVVDGMSIEYGDADGDGVEDALITIVCSVGVSTWWPSTIVMTPVPGGAEPIGQPIISSTEFKNGEIIGRVPRHGPDDPRCCPSEMVESVWRLRNGGWNEEETRVVPVS